MEHKQLLLEDILESLEETDSDVSFRDCDRISKYISASSGGKHKIIPQNNSALENHHSSY
jgi:hypothetical protein